MRACWGISLRYMKVNKSIRGACGLEKPREQLVCSVCCSDVGWESGRAIMFRWNIFTPAMCRGLRRLGHVSVLQNERSIMVAHGAAVSVDAWEPTKASDAYPRMSILETSTGVGDRGNPVGMETNVAGLSLRLRVISAGVSLYLTFMVHLHSCSNENLLEATEGFLFRFFWNGLHVECYQC